MSFGFQVDHKQAGGGFQPLPIGVYEVVITDVKKGETQSGKDKLDVTFTVRDDVQQEGGKRKLFDMLMVFDNGDNPMWKFQQYAKAVQLPDGTPINSMEEFAKAILYKAVKLKNKHEVYNGETRDRVAWIDVAGVPYGGGQPNNDDPFKEDGKPIDISDDDFPF